MLLAYHLMKITQATTAQHIQGILELQQINLPKNISEREKKEQGFVTCEHTVQQVTNMNTPYPHTIALANDKIIGYTLTMTPACRDEVEILKPMFELIDGLTYNGAPITDTGYVVMGQVCIDKAYRSQGLFYKMYDAMRDRLSEDFKLCITEVSADNKRSLRAHEKQGFQILHSYTAPDGHPWEVIVWAW